MRKCSCFLAVVLAATLARAQLYIDAAGGVASMHLRPAASTRVAPRYDATLGWTVLPWLGFEATVFTAGSGGLLREPAAPGQVYAIAFVSPPGGPPLNPDVYVPTNVDRLVHGVAAGPVFSWPVTEGWRGFARVQLVRTSIAESGYLTFYGRYYPPVASRSVTLNDWGGEAGLAFGWSLPRSDRWSLRVEGLYTATAAVRMTSLLVSLRARFDRLGPTAQTPLEISPAGGLAALRWRTGDGTSTVGFRQIGLGWRLAPWLSLDGSVLQTGTATNSRYRTYTFVLPIGLTTTPVTPIGAPPVLVPQPVPSVVTSTALYTIRRQIDGEALGVRVTLPLVSGIQLFTLQGLAYTTGHEWGRLLADASARNVATLAHRSLNYRPGLGLEWVPHHLARCRLGVEESYVNTTQAGVASTAARASFSF